MRLKDRVAVVTGGARGIGKKICETFLMEGASVYIFDINDEEGKKTADELKQAGGKSKIGFFKVKIINISSIVGVHGNAGQSNYSSSKAGIIGLTKTLARELAGRDILVNAIAPGYIQTEMTEKLSDKIKEKLMEQIPTGRLGR